MSTEDTLSGFNPDEFLPCLVNMLNMEFSPEIMLLACRSLANMTEALPGSSASIANSEAIPILCSKLTSVDYIDLAEQGFS